MAVALKLISRQSYSIRKLEERLLAGGYVAAEITECLERLQRMKYLNDAAFGARRIELLKQRLKSRAYVEADLAAQGLAAQLITELLAQDYPLEDEVGIARRLIEQGNNIAKQGQTRAWQKLARAGFSENTIHHCIPELSPP